MMMMNLQAKNKGCVVQLDILEDPQMYFIDGEELTPLEVSKLALFYSLNLDKDYEHDKKNNIEYL